VWENKGVEKIFSKPLDIYSRTVYNSYIAILCSAAIYSGGGL